MVRATSFAILSFVGLTLLSTACGWAQDEGSGAIPVAKSGAIGGAINSVGASDSSGAPTTSTAPPLQQLGHGAWLTPNLSPLHWGSLYIGSAQFLEGYQDIRLTGFPNSILRTSLFGTSVVYDKAIRGNHLAFQWQPEVAIVNGRFHNNLNNENLSLAYGAALTPRLTISLQDHLEYLPINNVLINDVMSPTETAALQSVQNPFLEGPGSWLTNNASVSLTYQLTERTNVVATPSYVYVHSYNPDSVVFLGSKQYAASIAVNHQLSETKTVGLFYSEDVVKFENLSYHASYMSFGGSFVDQVSPTWFINTSVAAAPFTVGTSGTIWSMTGYAGIQKRFEKSTATVAYSRGLSLNQYSSRDFTDRADFNYSIQLTRRTSAGAGIGYQGVSGSSPLSGEYANASVSYQLLPSVNMSATYFYTNQTGDDMQIYSAKQNSAFISLSWIPPRLQ